jgi:Na+-driven multidrug efflux pump
MWKYFLPAFASMMANVLYNIVDRIYIGQGVDALALSGLTVVFPLMIIIMAFGMLVGMGSSVRISLSLGEKDFNMQTTSWVTHSSSHWSSASY